MDFWQQQLQRPLPACGRCAQAKTQTKDTINQQLMHSLCVLYILYFVYEIYHRKNKYNLPGDQEGLFKLAVQLRIFFNSVIYIITLQLDMFCWFI
jgi:hypothetical protein